MHILFVLTDGFVDAARTLIYLFFVYGLPARVTAPYSGRSDEEHLYKIPLFKAAVWPGGREGGHPCQPSNLPHATQHPHFFGVTPRDKVQA